MCFGLSYTVATNHRGPSETPCANQSGAVYLGFGPSEAKHPAKLRLALSLTFEQVLNCKILNPKSRKSKHRLYNHYHEKQNKQLPSQATTTATSQRKRTSYRIPTKTHDPPRVPGILRRRRILRGRRKWQTAGHPPALRRKLRRESSKFGAWGSA